MENPTRQRQLEELDQVELCTRISFRSLQKGQGSGKPLLSAHFVSLSVLSSVYKKGQREKNVGSGL